LRQDAKSVHNMVMIQVNMFEVKAKLAEYLDRALRGERIVICRHNKPVAELRAIESRRVEPRPIGPLPGRPSFDVAASFFEPLPDDTIRAWEGSGAPDAPTTSGRARPGQSASRVADSKAGYAAARKPRRRPRRS